jgi:hypothetical protein
VNFLLTLIVGKPTAKEWPSHELLTLKALAHVAQAQQWLSTKTVKSAVPLVVDAWKALLSQRRWRFCREYSQSVLLRWAF